MSSPSDIEFRPTADWPNLARRAALRKRLRQFFDDRGFLEVETPLLSRDVVVERHIDPLPVELPGVTAGGAADSWWLQTSPEASMKRLLAAGGEAIYQLTRAFRAGERGPRHNVEFTIVEWYRSGHDMPDAMQFLSDLCQEMLHRPSAERITYREAFERYAAVNPFAADAAGLAEAARRLGVSIPIAMGDELDAWLELLLVEHIEPKLGLTRPVIVHDYPPSQSALAHVRPGPPAVAERFELYVDGVELANGYHELRDADELSRRTGEVNQRRRADGKAALPGAARLVSAMQAGLPDCCGVSLGFDRLVMLACGAKRIDDVMAFPIERA